MRSALSQTVTGSGPTRVDEVLEAERVALCGARYAHKANRQVVHGGTRRSFAGAGRAASRGEPATGAQCRGSGA